MKNSTPDILINEPKHSDLIPVSYLPGVLICTKTFTRWIRNNNELHRDLPGEEDWLKMGEYVGKTYYEVAREAIARLKKST